MTRNEVPTITTIAEFAAFATKQAEIGYGAYSWKPETTYSNDYLDIVNPMTGLPCLRGYRYGTDAVEYCPIRVELKHYLLRRLDTHRTGTYVRLGDELGWEIASGWKQNEGGRFAGQRTLESIVKLLDKNAGTELKAAIAAALAEQAETKAINARNYARRAVATAVKALRDTLERNGALIGVNANWSLDGLDLATNADHHEMTPAGRRALAEAAAKAEADAQAAREQAANVETYEQLMSRTLAEAGLL